jgi:hypothetical protein
LLNQLSNSKLRCRKIFLMKLFVDLHNQLINRSHLYKTFEYFQEYSQLNIWVWEWEGIPSLENIFRFKYVQFENILSSYTLLLDSDIWFAVSLENSQKFYEGASLILSLSLSLQNGQFVSNLWIWLFSFVKGQAKLLKLKSPSGKKETKLQRHTG